MATCESSRLRRVPSRVPIREWSCSDLSLKIEFDRNRLSVVPQSIDGGFTGGANQSVKPFFNLDPPQSPGHASAPSPGRTHVLEIGPGPRTEMQSSHKGHVRPDRSGSSPWAQHHTGQLDLAPSLADETDRAIGGGRCLKGGAVRYQSPREVSGNDSPQVPPDNVFGRVGEVPGVEAGSELPKLPCLDPPRHGTADCRVGHKGFGQFVQHAVHGNSGPIASRLTGNMEIMLI